MPRESLDATENLAGQGWCQAVLCPRPGSVSCERNGSQTRRAPPGHRAGGPRFVR